MMDAPTLVFILLCCVAVISFRTYVEQFCDNMQKRSTIGLMPHESDVFARAPCYNKRAQFGDIAAVIAWGTREAAARDEGPFYVFVAKTSSQIDAVFLAPSHMCTGAVAPNLHAKAIAHRWVSRFIYPFFKYTVNNPNSGLCSATTAEGCVYYKECGCIGAACGATLPRYSSDKLKRAQITDFWVGYEIGAPAPLLRNALPEGLEMRLTDDRRNQLVSPNGSRTLSLTQNGLLLNNGILLRATSEPAHVVLEETVLRMYDIVGAVQAELPLANGGEGPYVLVLTDDGSLKVYDRFDKIVTPSTELQRAVASLSAPSVMVTPTLSPAQNGLTGMDTGNAFGEDWTRDTDYARRLQQLLDWLTLRGLLKDYESKAVAYTKPLPTSFGTLDDFEDFDSQANYADRIRQLRALFA